MFDDTKGILNFAWLCLLPQVAFFFFILTGLKTAKNVRNNEKIPKADIVKIVVLSIVIFVPVLISMSFVLFPIFAIPTVLAVLVVLLNRKYKSTPQYEYSARKKYLILFNLAAVSFLFTALLIYGGFIYLILALSAMT